MIVPTPRLLLAALAGIIPIVLLPGHAAALVAAAVWLLGVACLAFADSRLVSLDGLTWEREYERKLSLGAPNPIALRLSNRSRRPVEYRVRDALPRELPPIGNESTGHCMAAEGTTLSYSVIPVHRGDYALGPLTARYRGPLGLAWRQRSYDLGSRVQVYPDLRVIRTYQMLLRRGHLQEIGLHASRRWGMGTEFERLREYTTDDEFRRINWPATARRHKPIAVDYETERSQNVVLALDAGRLMGVEIAPREGDDEIPVGGRMLTRLDYAVNASLLQAFVAAQYGDRTGLLVFNDRVTRFAPPRAGRGQFLALTDMLYDVQAEPVEADFAAGLGYLAARSPRRSLVILFTDLAEPDAVSSLVSQVVHLARRHLVLAVTLRDPAIERLATLPVDSSRNIYQRAVATNLLDERDGILRTLRAHGVLTLDVSADALSPSLINRYLEVKARGGL